MDVEAAHLWISDRVTRRAWRQKLIDDMEAALEDPDLDWRQRSRYNRDIAMLLRQVDEEKGELPTRVALRVDHSGIASYSMPGVDLGAVLDGWASGRGEPEPVSQPETPLEPPPGSRAGDGEWVREWVDD